jgi:hypothetical protein
MLSALTPSQSFHTESSDYDEVMAFLNLNPFCLAFNLPSLFVSSDPFFTSSAASVKIIST